MAEVEYILGHSPSEARRLAQQALLLRPLTERLLRDAGLLPGMRVLDVGCGAGDVSMLAAGIVGPGGAVLGVDRSEAILDAARGRAAVAGLRIEFRQASLEDGLSLGAFDLAVGRYVLIHQADPAAFVRAAASYVGPGGAVAFHEPYMAADVLGLTGGGPLWRRTGAMLLSAFGAAVPHPGVGARLAEAFHEAGLDGAAVRCDMLVGSGPASPLHAWLAGVVQSLLPVLERTDAAAAAALDVGTLEDRLRQEAAALHSQVACLPQFSAWARKP